MSAATPYEIGREHGRNGWDKPEPDRGPDYERGWREGKAERDATWEGILSKLPPGWEAAVAVAAEIDAEHESCKECDLEGPCDVHNSSLR